YLGRDHGWVAGRSRYKLLCSYCSSTLILTDNDLYNRWLSIYFLVSRIEKLKPQIHVSASIASEEERGSEKCHKRSLQQMAYHPLDRK
ncbi:unnamed protein product, partial [Heterotrigona itama]